MAPRMDKLGLRFVRHMRFLRQRLFVAALCAFCIPLACQTIPDKSTRLAIAKEPKSARSDDTPSHCPPNCTTREQQNGLKASKGVIKRPSSEAYVSVLQGELHAAQAEYPAAIERYREALLYDRDSDTLTLRLGELYARNGDYERALANAKHVIERSPDSLPGARLYAEILGFVGENEKAIRFLRGAIAQHPTDRSLSEMLAGQYIARGELREAEDVIEQWMSFETNAIDGYVTLATLFVERGEVENALRYLALALNRNAHAVDAIQLQRDLLYAQGAYPEALLAMQRLSAEVGDSLRTRQDLLLAQLLAGQVEEGQNLARHWLQSDNSIQMRMSLASSYERAGYLNEALHLLFEAERQGSVRMRNALDIEISRLSFQLRKFHSVEENACKNGSEMERKWQRHFMLALCAQALHENGKHNEAVIHLRQALDEAPASWRLLSTWNAFTAEEEIELGEDESKMRMTRALQAAPQAPDVIEVVALWHEESGNPELGRALLEKHASQGGNRSELWMALARHFERQGNPFAAIELAEESLSHSVSAETLNFVAFTMAENGIRTDEALAYAQRAVARAPLQGYIVDTLGWTHFRLGDAEKAIHFLRNANRLSPKEPEILFHLAKALLQKGDVNAAQKHLEDADKWVQKPALAKQIQALLVELRDSK